MEKIIIPVTLQINKLCLIIENKFNQKKWGNIIAIFETEKTLNNLKDLFC